MFLSVFNRVLVVIIALVILVGAVVTALVAAGLSPPDVLPYGWFEVQLRTVADATGGSVAGIIAISVAIAIGMIGVLCLELMPLGKAGALLISSSEKGVTTIDVGSVCLLAEKTGVTIHSVRDVSCSIKESVGGLLISCRASVALGSNLLEVDPELRTRITEAIEQLTGLSVAQVGIRIKYEPAKAKRLAVR